MRNEVIEFDGIVSDYRDLVDKLSEMYDINRSGVARATGKTPALVSLRYAGRANVKPQHIQELRGLLQEQAQLQRDYQEESVRGMSSDSTPLYDEIRQRVNMRRLAEYKFMSGNPTYARAKIIQFLEMHANTDDETTWIETFPEMYNADAYVKKLFRAQLQHTADSLVKWWRLRDV